MLLKDKKKQESIADYIVYMYQTEDLVRSYDLDPERIRKNIVCHYPISEDEKEELNAWYQNIASQMSSEGLQKEGHLSFVQEYVKALSGLKGELLGNHQPLDEAYRKASPYIEENLKAAGGLIRDEVQICLNGVYGYLLLRLQDKTITEKQQKMVEAFGEVLRVLSDLYKQRYNN